MFSSYSSTVTFESCFGLHSIFFKLAQNCHYTSTDTVSSIVPMHYHHMSEIACIIDTNPVD